MIDEICRTCLFCDCCTHKAGCDNYAPAGDDAEESAMDTYIEERRIEFAEDWRRYVSEDSE